LRTYHEACRPPWRALSERCAVPAFIEAARAVKSKGGVFLSIRQILFFGTCMAIIMSLCMSVAMAAINVGLNNHFWMAWLSGWLIGFLVSLPFSFFIPPAIQAVMKKLNI
jgi:hypothetical protein